MTSEPVQESTTESIVAALKGLGAGDHEPIQASNVEPALKPIVDALNAVISEQRHAARLREQGAGQDRQFQLFMEQSPFAMAILDKNMRYLAINPKWTAMLTQGDHDILGKCHYEVFPEISESWKAVHRRCLAGAIEKSDGEAFPRTDGTVDYLKWEVRPWYDQEGVVGGISIFTEDITRAKQIELDRERLNRFLEAVLKNVPSMVFVKEFAKRNSFSLLNKAGEDLLGLKEADLIGKNDHDLFPKEQADFFVRKDLEVFASGKVLRIEQEPIETPRGTRILSTQKVPIYDEQGQPHLLIGISNDITDELAMQSELEAKRLMMIHHSRLASLGVLAAGIAHEVNNPLAIVSGSLLALLKHRDDLVKMNSLAELMKRGIDRIAHIVAGLKKFSRSSAGAPYSAHPICGIVRDALVLTDAKSRKYHVLITFESSGDPEIFCDEVEISQVLVNLIDNAIDAVKTSAERWVRVSVYDQQGGVLLRVMDSGPRISDQLRTKIFDPFFTTKPVGEGTGLGLSISKGILDQHGARIELVADCPNTCFELRFKKFQ